MNKFIVLSVILCAFYITGLCQKIDGPVLKKELVGKYEGGQKNGLAQGKGTATGSDTYTGNFRKGLPYGEGTYTDSQGNIFKGTFEEGKKEGKGVLALKGVEKDSIIRGYWESDKYIGSNEILPYEISNKTGNVNPRLVRNGTGNKVEISILDPIDNHYIDANISFRGQAIQHNYSGTFCYEDAIFPLEFDIQYNSRSRMGTGTVFNTIHIKIIKPAYWVVTLKN